MAYHYDEFGECVEESDFVLSGSEDLEHRQPHSLELNGDRVISLGLSIYDIELPAEVKGQNHKIHYSLVRDYNIVIYCYSFRCDKSKSSRKRRSHGEEELGR